jgi:RNA polymerase sigma-70 factor (ECF subfamily)
MQANTNLEPFLAHRSFVRSLAASLLRSLDDVDEVEQQTWMTASLGPRKKVEDARSWLRTVVRNHAFNLNRQGSRLRYRERLAARPEALPPETAVFERLEVSRKLVNKVMELPETHRAVILMRYYEGQSLREIAAQLGVTPIAVKGRLQRGLAELRQDMVAQSEDSEANWRSDLSALVAMSVPTKGLFGAATPWMMTPWMLTLGFVTIAVVLPLSLFSSGALTGPGGHGLEPPVSNGLAVPSLAAGDPGLAAPPELTGFASQRVNARATQSPGGPKEIVLRIGDGFVFGEDSVRPDGDRATLDLYVQDIRHGVSLATLAGGIEAAPPMTSLGLPEDPRSLMALLPNAPLIMPQRDLWLLEKCTVSRPGIGLANSRQGQAYKLCLVALDGHPEALQRTVRIAYEPVPSVDAGGVLGLPEVEGQPSDSSLAALREAIRIGSLVPGDSFSRYIQGDYIATTRLADGTVPVEGSHVVLTQRLQEQVLLKNRSALFAGSGIGPLGTVELSAYGAIGVQGPMEGRIGMKSYGYLYVDGPVVGEVELRSYSTVVLEQGFSGTIKLRSYSNMLVRGPITGTLDAKGSCWSTLYLDGTYTTARLIELSEGEGDMHQMTLHVRTSDLPDGEYEDVGSWRRVIVGDPAWESLAK